MKARSNFSNVVIDNHYYAILKEEAQRFNVPIKRLLPAIIVMLKQKDFDEYKIQESLLLNMKPRP
jgi:hypothetical protein